MVQIEKTTATETVVERIRQTKVTTEKILIADEIRKQQEADKSIRLNRLSIKYTLAFTMADVINTLLIDVEEDLKIAKPGKKLKHENKENFSRLRDYLNKAKTQAAKVAEIIYKDQYADFAVSDSDYIYELLLTVIDKCGHRKTDNIRGLILDKIKKSYKSRLPYVFGNK